MREWLVGCHLYNLAGLSFVQQLLWKGFLHAQTEHATMRVLTNLLRQLSLCLGARAGCAGVSTFQAGMKDMAAGTNPTSLFLPDSCHAYFPCMLSCTGSAANDGNPRPLILVDVRACNRVNIC
jgi:hypothetical protein